MVPDGIQAIQQAVTELSRIAATWDDRAKEDRKEIYQAVGELRSEMKELSHQLGSLSGIVAQIAPIVRSFEDERQREIGSKGTVKYIWGALTAGVVAVAYVMHDVLTLVWPPRH